MNYVYIATSLDGYIATRDGGIDWLHEIPNPSNSDYGYSEFMIKIDALLMGRNSYEKVRTFNEWPYEKKVFVLSSTLNEVPAELSDKVAIVSGSLEEVLVDINSMGFKHLYIDGGQVIQSFLAADLIDELIITRVPILLGDGIPLFGFLEESLKFKHKTTEVYDNALVKSHYIRGG